MSEVQQPLGKHEVVVDSVELYDAAGDMSNPVLCVNVHFENGERSDKKLYPFKSDKSMEMTRGVLRAMGYDLDSRGLDEIMSNPKLLGGAKLQATVQENEWNGKITNQIAFLNPLPKKLDKGTLAKLNAALRASKTSNRNEDL